jgi:hypothetical protein
VNEQASPSLIHTSRGPLTADVLISGLMYRSFAANRGYGMTVEQHRRWFPTEDTDGFERRYQAENAQARIADDTACPGCGARGFRLLCGACERA